MPLTLPLLWKLGKRFMPTLRPCSIVILLVRIIPCILRVVKSDTFPFCKAPLSFLVGNTVLRANSAADTRENKASMRPESTDGIPQFWRDEKICGRLPSSPPAESPWRCLTFLPSTVVLHDKTYPSKMPKEG